MSGSCDGATTIKRLRVCEACGGTFECAMGGCWCAAVPVAADALRAIREEFSDCLCPTCLAARADSRSPGNRE